VDQDPGEGSDNRPWRNSESAWSRIAPWARASSGQDRRKWRSSNSSDFRSTLPRFTPEAPSESGPDRSAGRHWGTEEGDARSDRTRLAVARSRGLVPIPGTTKLHRLDENIGRFQSNSRPTICETSRTPLAMIAVQGARYPSRKAGADDRPLNAPRKIKRWRVKRSGLTASGKDRQSILPGTVAGRPARCSTPHPAPACSRRQIVTSRPGARTGMAHHPWAKPGRDRRPVAGSGVGAEPIEQIRPGDVIWFPPGEKHWARRRAPTTA